MGSGCCLRVWGLGLGLFAPVFEAYRAGSWFLGSRLRFEALAAQLAAEIASATHVSASRLERTCSGQEVETPETFKPYTPKP